MDEFTRISTVAKELVDGDNERNAMFAAIRNIWDMKWDNGPTEAANIRHMVSPGGHNTIRGMVNMLHGTDPRFNIPTGQDEDKADKVEKACKIINIAINDLRGASLSYDSSLSGALFDSICLKLARTADQAKNLQKYADKKAKKEDKKRLDKQIKRLEDMSSRYPFQVDVLNPESIHIKRGPDGVNHLVECRKRHVWDMRQEFGETVCPNRQLLDTVDYYEYWDWYQYCKWVDEEPLVLEEYDYPNFIPYIVHEVNGTRLFGRLELYPTLYPLLKGDIWHAQNLAMTMMRSNIFALGNPTWLKIGKSAHDATIPSNLAGAQIDLEPGDDIRPLTKDLVPNELREFNALVAQLEEESTINKMVFGKSPENVLAYSTVNLLVQGARHNIVALQVAMSNTHTELFRKVLQWIKESGESVKLYGEGDEVELKPDDIDDHVLNMTCDFKPDIPQDRLQLANMAKMLVDDGIISKHSARELAGWLQPNEEEARIYREQIRSFAAQAMMQQFQTDLQSALKPEEPPQQTPQQTQGSIPPPMGQMMEPGFVSPDVPLVQATGQPTEEFTQSAGMNMSALE